MLENFMKIKNITISDEIKATIANFHWLVFSRIFTMLIGMIITAITARYFGPVNYGQFNYALAFVSFVMSMSTLGFETLAVKALVDKEYSEGTIIFTTFILRFVIGIFLSLIAFGIFLLLEPKDKILQILVFIMLVMMIIKSTDVIEYWTHAHQKAKISSVIQSMAYIISAVLKIILVLNGGSLVHLALIYLVESIIIALAYIRSYLKTKVQRTSLKFDIIFAKKILSRSWYLIVSSLLVTVYMRIDQVMLGSMISDKSELGIYSVATQIALMWYFIPIAIITSFKPILLKKKQEKQSNYYTSFQSLYSIVGWISFGFAVFVSIFSDNIIKILYGADFLRAADILTISIWAGIFAMLGNVSAFWLVCEDLHKHKIIFVFVGAGVNIMLNLLLIPSTGAYGAAIATLIAQFISNFFVPLLFKKVRSSSIMMLKAFYLYPKNK